MLLQLARAFRQRTDALGTSGAGVAVHGNKVGQISVLCSHADVPENGLAVRRGAVQFVGEHVQLVAQLLQFIVAQVPGNGRELLPGELKGLIEGIQHAAAAGLAGMQLQAEGRNSDLPQLLGDSLQRYRLLCHKENPLTVCQTMCDHVSDGLALSCTGRAYQHKALALFGGEDSR